MKLNVFYELGYISCLLTEPLTVPVVLSTNSKQMATPIQVFPAEPQTGQHWLHATVCQKDKNYGILCQVSQKQNKKLN